MFEAAELGHRVTKARYKAEEPTLREALLDLQYELKERGDFPVVILIGGVDGAGKGETVNLLNDWMDPRLISTHAFGPPTEEESRRPRMWRYWQALPPKGRIGILFGSWYTDPILDRVAKRIGDDGLTHALDDIVHFERMLVHEGTLILKFWFHLSKAAQKQRLQALEHDPATRWRVTETDWANFKRYDRYRAVSERVLRETSTGDAPWVVVEGADEAYRSLTVGQHLVQHIRERLARPDYRHKRVDTAPLLPPLDDLLILDRLQLDQPLDKDAYREALEHWQGKLNVLTRHPRFQHHALVVVFEGNDAAGKGGAIRRITAALDARQYRVVPVAAPTEEERAQPYLWRFWRRLPPHGRVTVFDRSWYGRVLVERVEGLCTEADWMRAYGEINDFEAQLAASGVVLAKFWLAIDKDEQLRRFEEREATGYKRFKITPEDWRNREKWDDYRLAVSDMIERTSTDTVPWTLVEANNKYFARIKVLQTLCEALEAALEAS